METPECVPLDYEGMNLRVEDSAFIASSVQMPTGFRAGHIPLTLKGCQFVLTSGERGPQQSEARLAG